jgi:hypothetical protein
MLVGPVALGLWAVCGLLPDFGWVWAPQFALWLLAMVGLYTPAGRFSPSDEALLSGPPAKVAPWVVLGSLAVFAFLIVSAFKPDREAWHGGSHRRVCTHAPAGYRPRQHRGVGAASNWSPKTSSL